MTARMTKEELVSRYKAEKRIENEKLFNRIRYREWLTKQIEFFDLGSTEDERFLTAGNQYGKTEAGAGEIVYHVTGEYPDWWLGRRFDHPVTAWACGKTSLVVRDVQQAKLCGTPPMSALGMGLIPFDKIAGKPTLSRGVSDAYDTVEIKYKKGQRNSLITFKSYEQGREKFQGKEVHVIWLDEEPELDVYSECLARVASCKGILFLTYSPLKGKTDLTIRFQERFPNAIVKIGYWDAVHRNPSEEDLVKLKKRYPEYEHAARIWGEPGSGQGRVFTTPEETIKESVIDEVPAYWSKLWGIDFGIGHPFAAVLIAWDRDNDVIHVLHAIKIKDGLPINHAAAMKPRGEGIRVAWPKDGTQRIKDTGKPLANVYKEHGLRMLAEPAMWPDGGDSFWAGIQEMRERFESGRLKVASHLTEWFDEYRGYHIEDGDVVKLRDDLMSATRMTIMAKRYSQGGPLGSGKFHDRKSEIREYMEKKRFQENLDNEYWGW